MSDPAPRYRIIADTLADRIERGDLAAGQPLPAERRLAEDFGVSRVTVRSALEQLAEQGLVVQRQGSGTYVTERVSQPLSVLTSFSEDLAARGMQADERIISRGKGRASSEEVMCLGLTPGAPVSRVSRLRCADGQPLALENATVIEDALPVPEELGGSLYAAMAERGLRPVRAVQRLTAIAIDGSLAQLLGVAEHSPGLQITRVGYAVGDRPVEYTRSTFRGDRWDFVTELS